MAELPACELTVRVTPNSSQNKMLIQSDGKVRVWVNAPPVDGAANQSVLKLIAKTLGLAKSKVELVRGDHSKDKTVRISGLVLGEVMERIPREVE